MAALAHACRKHTEKRYRPWRQMHDLAARSPEYVFVSQYASSMQCLSALLIATVTVCMAAADWPQFRGVNASGVSDATNLPVEFGPAKNVIWKTSLPAGHSSPVLTADRIFVTASD